MSNLFVPKETVDRFLIRNESVELPVDDVAQRVFAVLETLIRQAYANAAAEKKVGKE